MSQHSENLEQFPKGSFVSVMASIEERMSSFEAELQKSLKNPSTAPTLGSLASDFATFKQFVLDTMTAFKVQMETLAREVDGIEMRTRRKMLLLHGVPEQKTEDTAQVVVNICRDDLQIPDFSVDDIRRCHRMGRSNAAHKPRPICVKMEKVAVRDKLWFSKAKLKASGKTISEFLTRGRHQVFMACRDRFGVSKCWTREGRIFVQDGDGVQHRVASLSELNLIPSSSSSDKPKMPATSKTVASKARRTAATKK